MVRPLEYRASSPAYSPQMRGRARRARSREEAGTPARLVARHALLERREQTRRGREGKNKRRLVPQSEELRPRGRFCLECQSRQSLRLIDLPPNPRRSAEQLLATISPGRQETNTWQWQGEAGVGPPKARQTGPQFALHLSKTAKSEIQRMKEQRSAKQWTMLGAPAVVRSLKKRRSDENQPRSTRRSVATKAAADRPEPSAGSAGQGRRTPPADNPEALRAATRPESWVASSGEASHPARTTMGRTRPMPLLARPQKTRSRAWRSLPDRALWPLGPMRFHAFAHPLVASFLARKMWSARRSRYDHL